MHIKTFKVAGVTKNNENGKNIQDVLKQIANTYKREGSLQSWDGETKSEALELGMGGTEFEGQGLKSIIRFQPDPDNEYDPNAIKVYLKDTNQKEHHVGYIKKNETSLLLAQLDDENIESVTTEFTGGRSRDIDYDVMKEKDYISDDELTRGLAIHFKYKELEMVVEEVFSEDEIAEIVSKLPPNEEELKAKQKIVTQQKTEATGQKMKSAGSKMMGCGCLLILFVTIPIILIAFFLL